MLTSSDFVDILGVDEAKAQEIYEAVPTGDRGGRIKWLLVRRSEP